MPGIAAFWQADFTAARRHLELAVRRYRRVHLIHYGGDPKVSCLARLGNTLCFLGEPDGARQARADALAWAEEIGHGYSRGIALLFGALLALDTGEEPERLRAYADGLSAGQESRHVQLFASALRGYLAVLDGDGPGGLAAGGSGDACAARCCAPTKPDTTRCARPGTAKRAPAPCAGGRRGGRRAARPRRPHGRGGDGDRSRDRGTAGRRDAHQHLPHDRHADAIFLPAEGARIAMIDPRDVAEVAATVLTGEGHDGRSYQLTGPEVVTFDDVALELTTVLGRPIGFVPVPDDAALGGAAAVA